MPGFYQEGEYDVSGTVVGVVEKSRMLDGKTISAGDAVIGIASSGLHTNGYSLARQILFEQLRLDPKTKIAEIGRRTIGDELLQVHVSYGPLVQALLKKYNRSGAERIIKGIAHITGGGFVDNLPRVLPGKCDVIIRKGAWPILPIFKYLQEKGNVPEGEMYQVFNMGIGLTIVVPVAKTKAVLNSVQTSGFKSWVIGEVVKGSGAVQLA
jgi:phosphoribosylformylglycinamidine cyclo-ligase